MATKPKTRTRKAARAVAKALKTVKNVKTGAKAARSATSKKHVHFFGNGKAAGNRSMKDLLGGKGSGLAEMTNAGLPVPPGFTIATSVCTVYYDNKGKLPPAIETEMLANLKKLETTSGAKLGAS